MTYERKINILYNTFNIHITTNINWARKSGITVYNNFTKHHVVKWEANAVNNLMQNKLFLWKIEFFLQCVFTIFTEAYFFQTSMNDTFIIRNSDKFSISWKSSAINGLFLATILILMKTGNIQNLWSFR